MENSPVTILSTRPIDPSLIKEAKQSGISIEVLSFIDTEPIQSIAVQQEIELVLSYSTAVVFTSMNAVEAVASFLVDEKPDWSIYCMGNTTQRLVKKYFGENAVAGTGEDAASLAETIIDDGIESLLFFCGDRRRDELPDALEQAGIDVTGITVYHTVQTPHKITKNFHGILFFSPSAAESFFSVNKLPAQTVLFAIGKTTAATLSKYTANKVITGTNPGKAGLTEQAIEYFS